MPEVQRVNYDNIRYHGFSLLGEIKLSMHVSFARAGALLGISTGRILAFGHVRRHLLS